MVNTEDTYYPMEGYNKVVNAGTVTVKKYYAAVGQTLAVRTEVVGGAASLHWLLSDNIGSATVAADAAGNAVARQKYSAYGETRITSGALPTKYQYTGQLAQAEIGLYFYVSRFYDPAIMHFTQADNIVPSAGDAPSHDRYAYVRNNPIRFNDPSGHRRCSDEFGCYAGGSVYTSRQNSYPTDGFYDGRPVPAMTPIVSASRYIFNEMKGNIKSSSVTGMKALNTTAVLSPGMYGPLKATALAIWASKVAPNQEWDHKETIRNRESEARRDNQYQEASGKLYHFDVWSNIHYGYTGSAAGFTAPELLDGAGLAQAMSDLMKNPENKNEILLRVNLTAPYFRSSDQPEDQAAIQLGIDLWKRNGSDLGYGGFILELSKTEGLMTKEQWEKLYGK